MIFNLLLVLASSTQLVAGERCTTHQRGFSFPGLVCPEGKEEQASLCYNPCPEGYKGRGPVCWKGWKSKGRGVGTAKKQSCSSDTVFMNGVCRVKCGDGYFEDTRSSGLMERKTYYCTQRPDRFNCEL